MAARDTQMRQAGLVHLWDHTPDEIRSLPIDALALFVLEAFGPEGWNVDSFFKGAQAHHGQVFNQPGVSGRIADAWAWLEAHALIGPNPEQSTSANARRMTQEGRAALQEGFGKLRAGRRLDVDLHPTRQWSVRRQFLLGEFELATFAALRAVEIRVRQLGAFPNDQIGVSLMAAAFNPKDPGPLVDPNAERGEQEAIMALFRGAIGTFKNPSSHRAVDFEDPVMASEVVLLADLLMRLLDQVEERQRM
jgi:uncharacterized protein (TIGR02391 family)